MKIVLTQPNYALFNKRAWQMPPYTLALLNACINKDYDVQLFDPNYTNMTEDDVFEFFKKAQPDIVGVSSISTEYIKAGESMNAIIRKALPNAIIINGGVVPTVVLDIAMQDPNVDYWMSSEGEFRFPKLLSELKKPDPDLSKIDGLSYWENGTAIIHPAKGYITDLDSVPLPDYGNLNILEYGNRMLKYSAGLLPRQYPFAVTITSRGCPYHCIFCAASTTSSRNIRFRSAENVLAEIDNLYKSGIREIIFLDDHFLGNRKRAIEIMKGLIKRNYNLTWKCVNLTIFLLDREIMELMKQSGCYQMTLSIESGNQHVLDTIVKKPVKLSKIPEVLNEARAIGLETIANFVIGFPGETWEQIRETFYVAERLNVDLVNFHIATPLPKTELMDMCIEGGYLPKDFDIRKGLAAGYGKGLINSTEFTSFELEILRAFEWDRINFSTPERCETIARMEGISKNELGEWRINTRRKCGVNVVS